MEINWRLPYFLPWIVSSPSEETIQIFITFFKLLWIQKRIFALATIWGNTVYENQSKDSLSELNGSNKEWCDEFETGLNIIIAIVQKV